MRHGDDRFMRRMSMAWSRSASGRRRWTFRHALGVEQAFDAREYFSPREGFFHEVVGADALGVELLGGLFVAADHYHGNFTRPGLAPKQAQCCEAVHAG